MGWNLKKKLKRATRRVIKNTVKRPTRTLFKTAKHVVRNPLDFKGALTAGALGVAPFTHPRESLIFGGLGAAGATYLGGASAAAGGGTASAAGAGAGVGATAGVTGGAAASTGAAAVAGASLLDKSTEFAAETVIQAAVAKELKKQAQKGDGKTYARPDDSQGQGAGTIGINKQTLVVGGIALAALFATIAG